MHGCKFRRQYSVDQYVIDFYCPEFKIAIEIDGDSHFKTGAEDYDKARQEYIESFGIQFLPASPAGGRFTNEDVCKNINGVCQKIYEKIEGAEGNR